MKKKYGITGMTCVNCSARIERVVGRLNGINSVNVNLMSNFMVVDFNEDKIKESKIIECVSNAGFGIKEYEYGNKTEVYKLKKRVIVSFIFLFFLMILSMQHMFGYWLPDVFSNDVIMCVSQLILTVPIIYVNRSYFIKGFKNLLERDPNMDSLVAVGSGASFIYGIFVLIRIVFNDYELDNNLYFESSGMILTLVTLGKFFEGRSKAFTMEAIYKIIELSPKTATVLVNDKEVVRDINLVKVKDIVLVKPGEKIPLDGTVIFGNGFVNQSAITGESVPVYKCVGDKVIGGTINENGMIKVIVDKIGEDGMLSQIVKLVEDASSTKAPIGRLADKISKFFVPIVISIALISAVIWLIYGATFEFALDILISVLVISCPCALGLATPVAIMVGCGASAKNGVLIKSAEALEVASKINTVVMDKTGTVTTGNLSVTDVLGDNKDWLSYMYSLEKNSNHPIAEAIVKFCKENNVKDNEVLEFNNVLGRGVKGVIDDKLYYCGNQKFLEENGIFDSEFEEAVNKLLEEGKTLLYFANKDKVIGVIAVMDTIKADSKEAILRLKNNKIKTILATGDNNKTAKFVCDELLIDDMESEVLPSDKEKIVLKYQEAGNKVIMIGDGINDAPALIRADIGIAIGNGTDIAIESADVVLTNNSLDGVYKLIVLSKKVINNIKMNLFWAFFYNILGIPIAAGLFYNVLGLKLNPMIAATAMSCSSVCVVLNALRLKKYEGR